MDRRTRTTRPVLHVRSEVETPTHNITYNIRVHIDTKTMRVGKYGIPRDRTDNDSLRDSRETSFPVSEGLTMDGLHFKWDGHHEIIITEVTS
tara:strand:- start:788 stop:1063 length:276 start_codon:yes stop_codon:yes gene_type:complete